ncbi:MAG: TlyA family rRNA (cytidine-2'-O)-methyltransferase [Clostridia bacterium]|nr:TlyA family rRNA (cytidine-2'-O)-methyltransferase [Clostridia bacterium]
MKRRAWERLVEEGWLATRSDAERWIMLRKVYAGGIPVTSAGQLLDMDAALEIRGLGARYVAKGGYKLEGALDAFGLDITGRVALDAGASTGGFTDCLIKGGCQRVYAVDVGFGQLHGTLRANPAVVNLERTNIGDPSLWALEPTPNLGTVDLSYLSLRHGVPAFAKALHGQGDLLCLVKPLFEIGDPLARRDGVIPVGAYGPLLHELCGALSGPSVAIRGVTHSTVTGNGGTVEFFLWITLGSEGIGLPPDALDEAIARAVEAGLSLAPYKKP